MDRFISGNSAIKTNTNENSVFLITPVNANSVLSDPVGINHFERINQFFAFKLSI